MTQEDRKNNISVNSTAGKSANEAQTTGAPICEFLRDYACSGMSRFHMPGHKGRGDNFNAMDITEIRGADSLYTASGIIKKSEENAAHIFDTAATYYSTEGSSQCIRAMLALALWADMDDMSGCTDGLQKRRHIVLAARNVHNAFITALILLGMDVEWLYDESKDASLCTCYVSADAVRAKLASMQERPAAVYLTSPNYLGQIQDIKAIAAAAHEYGIPLLVDNAHGAYLHFLKESLHPMDLGADICCDSAHKTLPALTGCAYLHISKRAIKKGSLQENDRLWYTERAKYALSLFGSTSPSYLLLASLDKLNPYLEDGFSEDLEKCINAVGLIKDAAEEAGFKMISADVDHGVCEPMKITIDCRGMRMNGNALADLLRLDGIECEYADPDVLVLMPSVENDANDYKRLCLALVKAAASAKIFAKYDKDSLSPEHANGISASLDSASEEIHINADEKIYTDKTYTDKTYTDKAYTDKTYIDEKKYINIRPRKAMLPVDAAFAPYETIDAKEAAGRIYAGGILACPPAIPIVVSGEVIPKEALKVMEHYGIEKVRVVL